MKALLILILCLLAICPLSRACPSNHLAYTISSGDTCFDIWNDFGIAQQHFYAANPNIDCDNLRIGQVVCLPCITYVVAAGDTCADIWTQHQITEQQFYSLNPGIDCASLQVGDLVCVGQNGTTDSAGTNTTAPTTINCTKNYTVRAGDNCYNIWVASSLTQTEFYRLNPAINCSHLVPGQSLCVADASTPSIACAKSYWVVAGDTCYNIWTLWNLTPEEFFKLNPGIDCTALPIGRQICVAAGVFDSSHCAQVYRVQRNDTCETIAAVFRVSISDLEAANPFLKCSNASSTANTSNTTGTSSQLSPGAFICLSSFGSSDQAQALTQLAERLSTISANVSALYAAFVRNPSEHTQQPLVAAIMSTLATPQAQTLLSSLQQSDSDFAQLQLSMAATRSFECGRVADSEASPEAKECFCSETQPYLYCQALLLKEFQQYATSAPNTTSATTTTTTTTTATTTTTTTTSDTPQNMTKKAIGVECSFSADNFAAAGGCIDVGCCVPLTPAAEAFIGLQGCLSMSGCIPYVQVDQFGINVCSDPAGSDCTKATANDLAVLEQLLESNVEISLQICFEFQPVTTIMDFWHISHCINLFQVRLFPLKGKITFGAGLTIIVIEISGGGLTAMYEAPGFICRLDQFSCEDFCLMKKDQIAAFFKIEWISSLGGASIFSKDWGVPNCESPDYGDAITAYYENWRFYSKGFETLPSEVTSNLNNIHYAFTTVSFQPSTSRWYLDFADAWSDVGVCVGIANESCSSMTPDCFPVENTCMGPQGRSTIGVAPSINSQSATCPPPTDCFNDGGPPPPDKRRVSCYTNLEGHLRPLSTTGDTPSYACGNFNYMLKKVGGNIVLSIGGWYDSNYFTAATNDANRDNFVDSILDFVTTFDFSGVDIDWEYPGFEHGGQPMPGKTQQGSPDDMIDCAKQTCQEDRSNDPVQLVQLLQALNSRLGSKTLSIAAPGGYDKFSKLDMKAICDELDYVNLMTYDMHGSWDTVTNHQSPLFDNSPESVPDPRYSVDNAVGSWMNAGCPRNKIRLGIPFYGRVFTGVSPGENAALPGLYQPHSGALGGHYSVIEYRDIVSNTALTTYYDEASQASYGYDAASQTFVSYDSVEAIEAKVKYVKRNGLAGVMFWALQMDDDSSTLFNAIASNLKKG